MQSTGRVQIIFVGRLTLATRGAANIPAKKKLISKGLLNRRTLVPNYAFSVNCMKLFGSRAANRHYLPARLVRGSCVKDGSRTTGQKTARTSARPRTAEGRRDERGGKVSHSDFFFFFFAKHANVITISSHLDWGTDCSLPLCGLGASERSKFKNGENKG